MNGGAKVSGQEEITIEKQVEKMGERRNKSRKGRRACRWGRNEDLAKEEKDQARMKSNRKRRKEEWKQNRMEMRSRKETKEE